MNIILTTDLTEALSKASSVPEAIDNKIDELRSSKDLEANILANRLESYRNHVTNRDMLNKQREVFNNLYKEIDKAYSDVLFRIEGRRKSFISAYQKLLQKPSDYVLQDISAFRIILFGSKTEMIDTCYKVAELLINYNVSNGFIPCAKKYHKEEFDSAAHPDVVVPKKSGLPANMQDYVEDYVLHPRSNGYQSLQITFKDTFGYFFEVQIRTIDMHIMAEYGSASHQEYKRQNYSETLEFDRKAINIPGYQYICKADGSSELVDFIGLEISSEILRRQKTYA